MFLCVDANRPELYEVSPFLSIAMHVTLTQLNILYSHGTQYMNIYEYIISVNQWFVILVAYGFE